MIQLADDGSVLAAPVKSSLHTRLHPDGVGGIAARAFMVTVSMAATTLRTAAAASRRRPRPGLDKPGCA
ncbi:hypothetical protein Prum_031100 [Phytohabitans rumicis]|uniref:Uncharacterized protein n=1 Tax=Phytohabitans rumicis TaxID=1076125 RepID=A0A6V8L3B9_9ACTN|nr:hypothetical protein Prum_031100 [Phytohabitans rumicis]